MIESPSSKQAENNSSDESKVGAQPESDESHVIAQVKLELDLRELRSSLLLWADNQIITIGSRIADHLGFNSKYELLFDEEFQLSQLLVAPDYKTLESMVSETESLSLVQSDGSFSSIIAKHKEGRITNISCQSLCKYTREEKSSKVKQFEKLQKDIDVRPEYKGYKEKWEEHCNKAIDILKGDGDVFMLKATNNLKSIYRNAIENAPHGFFVSNVGSTAEGGGKFLFFNDAVWKIYGCESKEDLEKKCKNDLQDNIYDDPEDRNKLISLLKHSKDAMIRDFVFKSKLVDKTIIKDCWAQKFKDKTVALFGYIREASSVDTTDLFSFLKARLVDYTEAEAQSEARNKNEKLKTALESVEKQFTEKIAVEQFTGKIALEQAERIVTVIRSMFLEDRESLSTISELFDLTITEPEPITEPELVKNLTDVLKLELESVGYLEQLLADAYPRQRAAQMLRISVDELDKKLEGKELLGIKYNFDTHFPGQQFKSERNVYSALECMPQILKEFDELGMSDSGRLSWLSIPNSSLGYSTPWEKLREGKTHEVIDLMYTINF